MLRRVVSSICGQPHMKGVWKQSQRSSTYFCFNTAMPVIPACYWSVLQNGVRVISEQTAGPLACVAVYAEAGPRYETSCNNGATHMFEHMSFRQMSALENVLRSAGGYVTVHTDREYQAFITTCPNDVVADVIPLLSQIFCQDYDPLIMEKAKCDIFKEIEEDERSPKRLMYHYLHQTAFQGSTLQRSVMGPSENYKVFDCSFLRSFVVQHYQPFRLVLAVSSIYSHHDIVCMAQPQFGCIPQTTNEIVCWPTRYTGSELRFRNDDWPFAHIGIAVETCGYKGKDFMTLNLMKHILGRWDASQSQGYTTWPLLAHASEISKLCVHYEAFYLPYRDVGLFGVYFVAPKETDMEDMILMIQDQFMSLCSMTQWSDVQRAQSSLKLDMAKNTEGCVASCHDMGIQMLYHGYRQNLVELYGAVDSIKNLEVRDTASRYLYDRCPVVSACGPIESVHNFTRIRAGMYWLRL